MTVYFKVSALQACLVVVGSILGLHDACGQYAIPSQKRLVSKARSGFSSYVFGDAIALSDRYLVVGEYSNDDFGNNVGAAYLFNAKNGRFLRRLSAGRFREANAGFGTKIAISGTTALIAAISHQGGRGAVYQINLGSGRVQREIVAPDRSPADYFGSSLAMNSDYFLIGANGKNSSQGIAYLYDSKSGSLLHTLTLSSPANGDNFGVAVALSGSIALISAPGRDSQRGAAYLFDARSGQQIGVLTASDRAPGDYFGDRLAFNGGIAVIAAPSKSGGDGAAYVYSSRDGLELRKLTIAATGAYFGDQVALEGDLALIAADGEDDSRGAAYFFDAVRGDLLLRVEANERSVGDGFGRSVALHSGKAAIGIPTADDLAVSSGAAILFGGIPTPIKTRVAAAVGAEAFGSGSGTFHRSLPVAHIRPSHDTSFLSALRGVGTSGGRSGSLWHELTGGAATPALQLRSTDLGGSLTADRIVDFYSRRQHSTMIHAQVRGPGVTPNSRFALLAHSLAGLEMIARSGTELAGFFPGIQPVRWRQIAQGGVSNDQMVMSMFLQRGVHGVTRQNDAAVAVMNHSGLLLGAPYRVGNPVSGGGTLGRLNEPVGHSYNNNLISFGGYWQATDDAPFLKALFYSDGFAPAVRVATQGITAPHAGGALYRSHLAQGIGSWGHTFWRSTLTGSGTTSRNNEGLWHDSGSGYQLVIRKGDDVDSGVHPGIRLSRLIQTWPAMGHLQLLLLVKLSGPKVNRNNDLALALWNHAEPGQLHILLREGAAATGTDGRKIRVIQRVDVDPVNGHYVVQCSLTGAANGNQALLTGFTALGNSANLRAQRQPVTRLQKGRLYRSEDGATRTLRSIQITPDKNKSGIGGLGQGQVINQAGEVSTILNLNGSREIRAGLP